MDAKQLRKLLNSCSLVSCDIELDRKDWRKLACVGFAISPNKAYVIPAHKTELIKTLLEHPVGKIWANGKFDLYFLKYRCGYDVKGEVHDVMAAWFSLYPELAGKSEGKGSKMTRKSLAFLSSLFTYDEWWKGVYTSETEYFVYNGKDCCITYDVFNHLSTQLNTAALKATYNHIRSLIWPCVDMLERGLNVDEELRKERMDTLLTRETELRHDLQRTIQPLLEAVDEKYKKSLAKAVTDRLNGGKEVEDPLKLFRMQEPTCTCCRHSSKKQFACWSCAGFESAPSKAALVARGGDAVKKKAELEAEMLGVCKVCNGEERKEWLEWNPSSHAQNKVVLYDILKLPKRMNAGSLSSDEDTLKSLLGVVQNG